jgi:formate hydrogenlyase subunit 4
LVAAGTIVLSASGSLAGRLGKDRAFAVTLLIGLCILFAGFLVATNSSQTNLSVTTGDKSKLLANHKRSDTRRKNRKQ